MDSLDKAYRVGRLFGKVCKTKENKSAERVALYAYRVANDLDIWTGEPRHPEDKIHDTGISENSN
jgi:hypothetical protein